MEFACKEERLELGWNNTEKNHNLVGIRQKNDLNLARILQKNNWNEVGMIHENLKILEKMKNKCLKNYTLGRVILTQNALWSLIRKIWQKGMFPLRIL